MADPGEGLDHDGIIRTSASIDRISNRFRPVLDTTVAVIRASALTASVYAYGSVTTGQASSPESDVDILTIGLDDVTAPPTSASGPRRRADCAHKALPAHIAAPPARVR